MHNNFLGFSFFTGNYDNLIMKIDGFLNKKKSCLIFTPSTEILFASYKDAYLRDIISGADILLPDSITLVKLAKVFSKDFSNRITGIDTMYKLGNNEQKKYKVYYLGAKESVIEKAVLRTEKVLPSFEVVGSHHGYYSEAEEKAIIANINKSGADILFVGTGFPKQEIFIHKTKEQINVPIRITVGGSFDVIAGVLKRAPSWMQKLGIEWLFRLLQEPIRIKRMSQIPFELLQLFFYEKRNGK